jgi:membrane-associated phospholipid phosphatase
MKRKLTLFVVTAVLACYGTTEAKAVEVEAQETYKLEVPEMKPELATATELTLMSTVAPESNMKMNATHSLALRSEKWKPDLDFFKSKTNEGVKPYKFMDDLTFVGIPLFAAGWAVKGDKAMFRVNNQAGKKNTQLLTNFKTGIDDYTQFFGPAMTVGLKLGGYEGRSDWPRLLASAGLSYAIMAGFVNGIKYTAKEMRPDGSTANSWPSGHTATSFVGATILHKEYGLTRSPWFSVAGYGVAAATGVMRVLNNRHWVSDVMSGAGIGIMSTELGYAIGDLFFKGKGLLRNDMEMDYDNPSFFSISMGIGLGTKNIDFGIDDLVNIERFDPKEVAEAKAAESEDGKENIEFRSATVVDAEGAYFFNKYIGIGGRFRVRAMSAKSFERFADIETMAGSSLYAWDEFYNACGQTDVITVDEWDNAMWGPTMEEGPISDINAVVESDHLTEFSASLGLYFNLPLCKNLSLGTKLLIGRSFMQEMDIDGQVKGYVKDMDYNLNLSSTNGVMNYTTTIEKPQTGGEYEYSWDYVTVGGKSSTTWGTGISLTYRYKSNFSWRLYVDYDYTEKEFTAKYDPLNYMRRALTSSSYVLAQNIETISPYLAPAEYKKTKKMNYVTIGLSFLVNL